MEGDWARERVTFVKNLTIGKSDLLTERLGKPLVLYPWMFTCTSGRQKSKRHVIVWFVSSPFSLVVYCSVYSVNGPSVFSCYKGDGRLVFLYIYPLSFKDDLIIWGNIQC